jgi:outer membrane receptor protein involved in Fe transport
MFRTSIRIASASLAIASLLLVMPAYAQSTASIRGVLRDVAGDPLPGATVTVKYTATAETESTVSGVDGTFAIAGLLAGKVEVEVSLSGFATQTSTVSLEAGQEASLDFTLTLARFAEEVTVTALKRGEQRLVDIPLAVTAVGGDELEEIGAQSIADVIQTAPGATAYESGPGANVPQIRGISATSGDSPIGYYLDEMPFALVGTYVAPDVSMFDLERVEILRGPQGTLYGDGALGGVVRFITRDPDLQAIDAKGDLSYSTYSGGEENYTANAAVSVPIAKNVFAIRATASYRSLGGWVDSPYFGENINPQTFETYRVKALVRPLDRLRITASAWFNRTEADGTNDANDEGIIEAPIRQPSETSYDLYSAVIEYEADAFSLISASSYKAGLERYGGGGHCTGVCASVQPNGRPRKLRPGGPSEVQERLQVRLDRGSLLPRQQDPGQHRARGPRPVLQLRQQLGVDGGVRRGDLHLRGQGRPHLWAPLLRGQPDYRGLHQPAER